MHFTSLRQNLYLSSFDSYILIFCVFFSCCIRRAFRMNDLFNTLQEKGHDPVCLCKCLTQSDFCMNDLLHIQQENRRDPACIILCFKKCAFRVNDLLHTLQENGCDLIS